MKSRKCFQFSPPPRMFCIYFIFFFKALAAARFSQRFWRDERERYRYKLVSWHRRRVASCYSVARSSAHRGGSCTCREAFERLLQYLVSATRLSLCWRFLVCFLCCLIFFFIFFLIFLIFFFGKVTLKEKKKKFPPKWKRNTILVLGWKTAETLVNAAIIFFFFLWKHDRQIHTHSNDTCVTMKINSGLCELFLLWGLCYEHIGLSECFASFCR